MKKLFALILAIVMVMGLATTAFAAEETGSITITGAHSNYTYEIYKILDLESYADKNYSYKVNDTWKDFFATEAATAYFTVNESGYVSEKEGSTLAANIQSFAQAALAYAQANNIDPEKSTADENDTDITISEAGIKFSNLALGYYLIDSDLGALCGLTTTNANAVLNAKNTPPVQDKQVQEDGTGNWGESNVAGIGETVNFLVTIKVHNGAQNYILHDNMSEGLTFDVNSVKVVLAEPGDAGAETVLTEVSTEYYSVITNIDEETHADMSKCDANCASHEDCTFDIVFDDEFCAGLATNDKLFVYYSAVLNEKAVIGDAGNPNNSRLEFGEGYCTGWDETITKTYSFDIVKTDSENTLISGAKFSVYETATDGAPVKLVKIDDNHYRRAVEGDWVTVEEIVVKDGLVTVDGFDNGTYYLEETEAPEGYNKLTGRISFTIADQNLSATFVDNIYSTGTGVHVVNNSGTMLPETGGMGTTLFYVFGAILFAGAAVLLVTKKRMAAEN